MAALATGQISIVDLADGKSLSCYINSNQPRIQVQEVNAGTFSPDWSIAAGNVVLTPVVYADQAQIPLTQAGLTIDWKRREGSASETALTAGESVASGVLTISQNKMASIFAGTLTYIVYVTYTDPDTGEAISVSAAIDFALVKTGQNAKNCWISGEQVFKYASGSPTPNPASITLTANIQNVTFSKWQYKNSSGVWTDYPTGDGNTVITTATLVVKPAHAVWVNDVATIRAVTSDAGIGDATSVYKVADGAAGAGGSNGVSASVAMLTNENVTFAGNVSGQVSATSVVCNVVAYTGTTKVTPTVGTVTGAPTGMTVAVGSTVNSEIPITLTIAANATLGGAGQQQGTLSVPVTSPVSTTLAITWSKVNTGATGAAGANAVVFSVYAPSGAVFQNQSGSLTLATAAYDGASAISSGATYVWKKYTAGSWATISGQTASTLSVSGSDVVGIQAYQCTMTYGGKTYTDTITLTDKTDNYQAAIESTGGSVFKNTVGTSCLICRIWQNGAETDALKSVIFSATAPSSPATGDFYYKITTTTPQMALMRYSGSAWVDVTADATYKHTRTYTWYRRDKDGNALDGGAAFATGKVIYIDGDDVTVKTTFTCEAS
jgi:hypothetical protein